MMPLQTILYIFTLFTTIYCVEVQKCKGINAPPPVEFFFEGCDKLPCPLVKNTTTNAHITFRIPHDTETGKIKVDANPMGAGWFNYPLPDEDMCHSILNSYCPLDKNEVVTYHLAMPVRNFYPLISLKLRIYFWDEKNETIACFELPCKVVKPK